MPLRALPENVQKKAQEELNEMPGQVKENLEKIREWIEKQPHLKCRIDDQWLVVFLRGCKFSLERTKEKLDYFYTIRSSDRQFFAHRDPFSPKIQEFLSAGYFVPLPKPQDPTSPRYILIHTPHYDPEKMTPIQAIKTTFMILDVLLDSDDSFVINGQELLINVQGFDYRMLTHLTPSIVKRLVSYVFEGYPLRMKGIHIINSPVIYETILKLVRSLVSKKINQRIKLYGQDEFTEIYKVLPRSILPLEYGGTAGTLKDLAETWKKNVENYEGWFREDAIYGVDESKRERKARTAPSDDYIMGVEGSFRTLTID